MVLNNLASFQNSHSNYPTCFPYGCHWRPVYVHCCVCCGASNKNCFELSWFIYLSMFLSFSLQGFSLLVCIFLLHHGVHELRHACQLFLVWWYIYTWNKNKQNWLSNHYFGIFATCLAPMELSPPTPTTPLHIRTKWISLMDLGCIGSDVVEFGVAYFSLIFTLHCVFSGNTKNKTFGMYPN